MAAAIAATLIQVIEPFEHGVWLVAYLFLVGFAAQLLLRRGEASLAVDSVSTPFRRQVVLWNVGSVAVPGGVLADSRLLVVVGAICLLAALTWFWRSVRRTDGDLDARRVWLLRGYCAFVIFMAGSTFVGTALAWDTPWL